MRAQVSDAWTPEDIEDELRETNPVLLPYFRQMPVDLWPRHFEALEKLAAEVGGEPDVLRARSVEYLSGVLEGRNRALTEYVISDESLRGVLANIPGGEEGFGEKMQEVLASPRNALGEGQTARVKRVVLEGFDRSVAVKFLLTPTAKTLSVNGEHDMLREVETITMIEGEEEHLGAGRYIRVPHPYFYYKRKELQCYGMSEVRGMTLEELLDEKNVRVPLRSSVLAAAQKLFASKEAVQGLQGEVDLFVEAMHKVCLHGDIKLKNIMVDEDGMLYLIDFGQSVPVDTASEKTREQFENLQDRERAQMHTIVHTFLGLVRQEPSSRESLAA